MLPGLLPFSILQYIADEGLTIGLTEPTKLPPLGDMARDMGVSRGRLRADLVAAQAYGVVEMRPGDGTYVCPFGFYTAIRTMGLFGTACEWKNFDHLYRVRALVELGFWDEAVGSLHDEDREKLMCIVEQAERKLKSNPIEVPHREHRDLHLLVYRRLESGLVQGILKAYWDVYEAAGLHRYYDYSYYESMWRSHRQIAEAIQAGRPEEGKEVLAEHFDLLEARLYGTPEAEDRG